MKRTGDSLPNKKNVNLVKMKYIDLNTQDFCKKGKSVKRLLSTPKMTSQEMNLKSNH